MNTSNSRTVAVAGVAAAAFYFVYCLATPSAWHFIDGVNLIFHEAGHTILAILGIQFLAVAGGTLMQLAVPFGIVGYFLKTGQRLSAAVTLMWAGESLLNVYVYAADAQAMSLDLIGGENAIHDWNYMLEALHVIRYTPQIATLIHMCAALCIIGATAYAGYLLFSVEWNSPVRRSS